jgi:hypothetical protein
MQAIGMGFTLGGLQLSTVMVTRFHSMNAQARILSFCALLILLSLASPAQALTISRSFDIPLDGGPDAAVAVLTMKQNGKNVDFDLFFQVKNVKEMKDTFISSIDLGYSGPLLRKSSFIVLPGSTKISTFSDSFSSINDGYQMPLTIALPTSWQSDRFLSGEHARWRIKNVTLVNFSVPVQRQLADINAFALLQTEKIGLNKKTWFNYFDYVAGMCVSPIPEPSSLAMLFAGIGLLSLRLRRR